MWTRFLVILAIVVLTFGEARAWTSPEYDREKAYERQHQLDQETNVDREEAGRERRMQESDSTLSKQVDPRLRWVEIITTYAMVMNCAPSGRCDPETQQIPIKSDMLGKPFSRLEDCLQKARHDTQLLLKGQKIPEYVPGPVIGGYRTFQQPKCYPYEIK